MPIEFSPQAVMDKVRLAAMRGVVRATETLKTEMVRLIQEGEKSGKIYGRRKHQASAPGEAPASDTGRLVSSLRTEYDLTSVSGKVIVGASYGMALEYGTVKMEPRPFARPALANKRQEMIEIIAEEINRVSR